MAIQKQTKQAVASRNAKKNPQEVTAKRLRCILISMSTTLLNEALKGLRHER